MTTSGERRAWIAARAQWRTELAQGVTLMALTGFSVGTFLGMLAIATRALGR